MLITDLTGIRKLFMSTPRQYVKVWAVITPSDYSPLPAFTGKFVKSLLIEANPKIKTIFESRIQPKPISISTLYRIVNGKRIYLWKIAGKNTRFQAKPGVRYYFEIGFSEDVLTIVNDTILNIDGVKLLDAKWYLVEVEFEIHKLPVKEEGFLNKYSIEGKKSVKIEFRTPALLLDPYKKTRVKRFLPLPGIVFSYNIGELLRLGRGKEYFGSIILVNSILNETYHILNTVKPILYVYEGKELPGLTGFAKYMIDHELVKATDSKLFLENILLHASIMGVGTSRANGFGNVTIKVE